uniref:DUF8040 domain-containing protein n=1 Tax=Hordeum vulgare subsp. vulgare TaxID=112509 RepID=A0A8I6YK69_HORVV
MHSSMNQNYSRRSRNEDDFVHFIFPTLQGSSSQSSERRAIHTSILNGVTYVYEALTGHEVLCEWRFHMERSIFQVLVQQLYEKHLLQDARFQYGADSVSTYFHAVLNAITRLTCNFIQPSIYQHPILRQPKFLYFRIKSTELYWSY